MPLKGLTVVGPKGAFHNVVILDLLEKESQVEVSLTDCLQLGVKALFVRAVILKVPRYCIGEWR